MHESTSDAQLRAEQEALERELQRLRAAPRKFREDAHETLDLSVKAAKDRVDTLLREGVYRLSRSVGSAVGIPGLADAIALTDPAIVKRFHALIDAEPGSDAPGATFGPLTRTEYTAERARLEAEIRPRAQERARRIEARRHAAAEAAIEADPGAALDRSARKLEPGSPGYGEQVERHKQEAIPHG